MYAAIMQQVNQGGSLSLFSLFGYMKFFLWEILYLLPFLPNIPCLKELQRELSCISLILLVSKIFWLEWNTLSLQEWKIWYLILACFFPSSVLWQHQLIEGCDFYWKNLWQQLLEASNKQVPQKAVPLKIWIDHVNQILKNKEKIK